jgi:hypothetical protein
MSSIPTPRHLRRTSPPLNESQHPSPKADAAVSLPCLATRVVVRVVAPLLDAGAPRALAGAARLQAVGVHVAVHAVGVAAAVALGPVADPAHLAGAVAALALGRDGVSPAGGAGAVARGAGGGARHLGWLMCMCGVERGLCGRCCWLFE